MVSPPEIFLKKSALYVLPHVAGEIKTVTIEKNDLQQCGIILRLAEMHPADLAKCLQFIADKRQRRHLHVTALDSNGNVLESYDLSLLVPINTPGQTDGGAFRGIMRPTADIAALTVSDGFVVLTDLTFSHDATAVPEPASQTLLCLGTLSVGGYCWRRNKQCPCQ